MQPVERINNIKGFYIHNSLQNTSNVHFIHEFHTLTKDHLLQYALIGSKSGYFVENL